MLFTGAFSEPAPPAYVDLTSHNSGFDPVSILSRSVVNNESRVDMLNILPVIFLLTHVHAGPKMIFPRLRSFDIHDLEQLFVF